jgi:N-acetylglucosamine-6-phosphate deacetylase
MTLLLARDVASGQTLACDFQGGQARLEPVGDEPEVGIFLSAGWVDLQVNGFGGLDLNDGQVTAETVSGLVRRLWAEGVAAFCPTVVTASTAQIELTLSAIAQACQTDPDARAAILSVHLEGPYLSSQEGARGAHDPRYLRPPDWDEFSDWQALSNGAIRLVTLAPELPGAVDFIRRAVGAGVVVALGHTHASTAELAAAVDAGARLSTHLGNGIGAVLPRHPNPIWDQLADDRLWASFIFDGHHLPASVMRVALRAKGPARSVLVSDATAPAGMPPGRYDSMGGQVELLANGRLQLAGTPYLAGSASSLRDGVDNAVRLAGCTLSQAVQMVTRNPLLVLGSELPGAYTLFRWDAARQSSQVLKTIVGERVVYSASGL